jgi:hypothetical protein
VRHHQAPSHGCFFSLKKGFFCAVIVRVIIKRRHTVFFFKKAIVRNHQAPFTCVRKGFRAKRSFFASGSRSDSFPPLLLFFFLLTGID